MAAGSGWANLANKLLGDGDPPRPSLGGLASSEAFESDLESGPHIESIATPKAPWEDSDRIKKNKEKAAKLSSRRLGKFGSHGLRKALKAAAARAATTARAGGATASTSHLRDRSHTHGHSASALAKAFAKGARAKSKKKRAHQEHHDERHAKLTEWVMSTGTPLQKKVMILALGQLESQRHLDLEAHAVATGQAESELEALDAGGPEIQKVMKHILFGTEARYCTSTAAEASKLGIAPGTFRRGLVVAAAAVFLAARQSWAIWLQHMKALVVSGKLQCLMCVTSRTYDETPLKLRLSEDAGQKSEAVIAKVLQTRLKVGWLFRHVDSGHSFFVHGLMPTKLQALEKTKAEDIAHAQTLALGDLPSFADMATASSGTGSADHLQVHIASADRYSANLKAERGLQAARPQETPLRLPCIIHMASTSATWQLDRVSSQISAVVACGLILQPGGMTRRFKKLLEEEINERLLIFPGDPPGGHIQSHREQVYDLFLGLDLSNEESMRAFRKRRAVQRAVLDRFLCGDLQDETNVHFYARHLPITRDEAMDIVRKQILNALVPSTLKIFPRHRWMGGEISVDWLGLIHAHHGLLKPVLLRLTEDAVQGSGKTNVQSADTAGALLPLLTGWESAAEQMQARESQEVRSHGNGQVNADADAEDQTLAQEVVALGLGMGGGMEIPQDELTGLDWATINRNFKKKVYAWAKSNDLNVLCLIRSNMRVIVNLLRKLLAMSKEQWELRQQFAVVEGDVRAYRLTQVFLGEGIEDAFQALSSLFLIPPPALPRCSHTMAMRVLMFQLLARVAGALHFFLRGPSAKCPYLLFGLLVPVQHECQKVAEKLVQLRPCELDSLTHEVLQKYPTVELLMSDQCLDQLHGIALLADVDVASIESRHAAVKSLVDVKSKTWSSAFELVSADFLCRQWWRHTHHLLPHQRLQSKKGKAATAKAKIQKRKAAKTKKRRSGGGCQRAYFHQRLHELQGAPLSRSKLFKKINSEIKQLSREELQKFKELGEAANISYRAGAPAFPPASHSASSHVSSAVVSSNSNKTQTALAIGSQIVEGTRRAQRFMELSDRNHNERQEANLQAFLDSSAAPSKEWISTMQSPLPTSKVVHSADPFPTAMWVNPCAQLAQASSIPVLP